MQACAQHIVYQLPNKHTRVSYLIDTIECSDTPLQVAMALIEQDSSPLGARNNFKKAAAQLLPTDPVVNEDWQRPKDQSVTSQPPWQIKSPQERQGSVSQGYT